MTPVPPPAAPLVASRRTLTDRVAPWRWAWLGWGVTVALLVAGLPPFLRMPLWCDANLYDVAAYNVLSGGVHYRDVFDTNLPGFVWLMAGARWLFGPSSEAVRAVDLAFVTGVAAVTLRFAWRGGASAAGIAWAAAGLAAFYPYISEFNHLQRDVWMMLPVLGAALIRFRRVRRCHREPMTDRYVFGTAVVEGAVWGLAFWVKPHVAVMAVAAWLAVAGRLAGTTARPWRRLGADLAGVFVGGPVVIAAGVGWLVWSGAWHPFLDVFTHWNTKYLDNVLNQFWVRANEELAYFHPWSMMTAVAVPLAVLNLVDGRIWSRRWDHWHPPSPGLVRRAWRWLMAGPADDGERFARALLAAVYLGWVGMALFLQRQFHYAHVPEVLLMFALFAANRWAVPFALIAWQVVTSGYMLMAVDKPGYPPWRKDLAAWQRKMDEHQKKGEYRLFHLAVALHPALNPDRAEWWPVCFRADAPRELRNAVAFDAQMFAGPGADWVQLGAVEDFLRDKGLKDGELICWHDSPCGLYRRLGIKPGIRFMHVTTASEMGRWQYAQVKAELAAAAPHARYAVGDMFRVMDDRSRINDVGPDGLPTAIQPIQRQQFPWTQPVVFRSPSGRYVVVAVTNLPTGECMIPVSPGYDDEPPPGWGP